MDAKETLPDSIEADRPMCPYCERPWCVGEMALVTVTCTCGHKFEVERVYVSRPLEQKE